MLLWAPTRVAKTSSIGESNFILIIVSKEESFATLASHWLGVPFA
jgi:hypothetical protein